MMVTRDALKVIFNTIIDTMPEEIDSWKSTGLSSVQWYGVDALEQQIPTIKQLFEMMNNDKLDPVVRKQLRSLGYGLIYGYGETISEEMLQRALDLSMDLQSKDYTVIIACYYSGSQYATQTKAFHVRGTNVHHAVANVEESQLYLNFKSDYPDCAFRVVAKLEGHHDLA